MNKVRKQKEKKNTTILVIILLTLMVGIGYAALNELLTINTSIKYETINWDVGFKSVKNGGGTVAATTSISDDKKTITVSCDLGMSTESETCIAIAEISNNSTFKIKLNANPTITYDGTYIDLVSAVWTSDSSSIKANDTMAINETKEIKLTITTKELSSELLPSESLEIPVTFTMNWVEDGAETTTPDVGEEPDAGEDDEEDPVEITNLFNPDEVENGGIYHSDSGNWMEVSTYASTGFIPVEAGKTYYIKTSNTQQSHITFYKTDKTFRFGRYIAPENGQIVVPSSIIGTEVAYFKVGLLKSHLSSLVISTESLATE